MPLTQLDVQWVLKTLRLSPLKMKELDVRDPGTAPARALAKRMEPYLTRHQMSKISKAAGALRLFLRPETVERMEDKMDIEWERLGVSKAVIRKKKIPELAIMASEAVRKRAVVRIFGKGFELWLSRKPLKRKEKKKKIYAALHSQPGRIDANMIFESTSAMDMPYELFRSLFRDVVERHVESPQGAAQAITKNLWRLIGKRFASEGWMVSHFLGSGTSGIIFSVSKRKTLRRVLKVMTIRNSDDRDDFYKEIEMQQKFHRMNLAPRIFTSRIYHQSSAGSPCVGVGAFMMERIHGKISDILYGEREPKEIRFFAEELIRVVMEPAKAGICHGDLHSENVAIQKGRLVLIDFGWSLDRAWPAWDTFKLFMSFLIDVQNIFNNRQDDRELVLCVGEKPKGTVTMIQDDLVFVKLGYGGEWPIKIVGQKKPVVGSNYMMEGHSRHWACKHYKRCFDRVVHCFIRVYMEVKKTKMDAEDRNSLHVLKEVFKETRRAIDSSESIWDARKAVEAASRKLLPIHKRFLKRVRAEIP